MNFEPTITTGTIVTIIVNLIAVVLGVLRVNDKIANMEMKINMMWSAYKKDHNINYSKDED